jgi:hypothetical protein
MRRIGELLEKFHGGAANSMRQGMRQGRYLLLLPKRPMKAPSKDSNRTPDNGGQSFASTCFARLSSIACFCSTGICL